MVEGPEERTMTPAPLWREPQTLGVGKIERQSTGVWMHAGAELDSPHYREQLGSENYKCAPGTAYVKICMCV